jgi:hypothetical protein
MAGAWEAIKSELLTRAAEDRRVRAELAADGSLFQGYHPRMQAIHDANAARLLAIMDAYGWPHIGQVGPKGMEAAWLIAQHAIARPAVQRRALELLKVAVRNGNAPALHAAMLEDRIRCLEGRPQLYGTQFDWDAEGNMSPLPFDDVDLVNLRRQEIGLKPLQEDLRDRRAVLARGTERPPADWASRQHEMEQWCRRVGWRE